MISTPSDLAAANFADIRLTVEAWPETAIALAFRMASAMDRDPLKERLLGIPLAANEALVVQTFRVWDIDTSLRAKRFKGAVDPSALPASFEKHGDAADLRDLSDNASDQASIDTFLNSG